MKFTASLSLSFCIYNSIPYLSFWGNVSFLYDCQIAMNYSSNSSAFFKKERKTQHGFGGFSC